MLVCAAWALGWLAQPAAAAQVLGVHVARRGTHFTIAMRIALHAPPWAVFAALQDYAAMPRYNPDLRRVRVEPTARPNRVRLFTTVHVCVLFFCRTLHQEQIMTARADARGGVLRAALVPGAGDFRSGHARWIVRPCRSARAPTCLDARIELQPAFWVPPLIGPWLMRLKMDEEARRSGRGLAEIAGKILARSRRHRAAHGSAQPAPAHATARLLRPDGGAYRASRSSRTCGVKPSPSGSRSVSSRSSSHASGPLRTVSSGSLQSAACMSVSE